MPKEASPFLLFRVLFPKVERVHLSLAFILLLALNATSATEDNSTSAAKVISVDGLASLEPKHTNLIPNMSLSQGDRITVMAKSKLRLRLASGAVVQLGPHSELNFEHKPDQLPRLRLAHGEILAVSADKTPIEVRSGKLKLHIEGDGFFLSHQRDKPDLVCVYSGLIHAKWPLGESTIEGKAREQAVFINPEKEKLEPAGSKRYDPSESELQNLQEILKLATPPAKK